MSSHNISNVKAPLRDVYANLKLSANNVFNKLSDSGVIYDSTVPDIDELELDWIHGYRGYDCRNNVFYVDIPLVATKPAQGVRSAQATNIASSACQQLIVYPAAAIAIVFNPIARTQRYFRGHSDDILAIDVYQPNRYKPTGSSEFTPAIAATGQQGKFSIYYMFQ